MITISMKQINFSNQCDCNCMKKWANKKKMKNRHIILFQRKCQTKEEYINIMKLWYVLKKNLFCEQKKCSHQVVHNFLFVHNFRFKWTKSTLTNTLILTVSKIIIIIIHITFISDVITCSAFNRIHKDL